MNNYLDSLNTKQLKAVECINGPSMVIAGAGSGKTRVLTYRIAYLIGKGIDPFHILALTFTNKAAREMKKRINNIVGGTEAQNLWMGTFHSVFAKILRIESDKIGYSSSYTIYDIEDTKRLLSNIIKEQKLDTDFYKTKVIQNRISQLKNNLITATHYKNNMELQQSDYIAHRPKFGEIYELYTNRCFKSGVMDFDDLLLKTYQLLNENPDVLKKYQHRFQYVLVDEYQDTNHVQHLIVKALASLRENICVVGDDAQSIYAFRGANVKNILSFSKDYSDAHIFKLEQNYRSTKTIVNAANSSIKHNVNQIKKKVWTDNEEGEKIIFFKTLTDNEEGLMVAKSILEKQSNNQNKSNDFAVLYRMNYQSRAIEEAFRKRGIKYKIYGGLSFYQRKEIKDILAYLRLCVNKNDEEAFRRIINYPSRGIGKTTIERLTVLSNENNISMWKTCQDIKNFQTEINSKSQTKIIDFIIKIKSFSSHIEEMDAHDFTMHIAQESGIIQDLTMDKTTEGVNRSANLKELLNSIQVFSQTFVSENKKAATITDFLEDVALLTSLDNEKEEYNNHVSLMTVHLAKGLEFKHVYIVGLEENVFPAMQMNDTRDNLEEERRLFYVALTRAIKTATLSMAESRYQWGKRLMSTQSRFIEEIDIKYLNVHNNIENKSILKKEIKKKSTYFKKQLKKEIVPKHYKKIAYNASENDNSSGELRINNNVEHSKFGLGKVILLEGEGGNRKATILFKNAGEKKLLLKFAKLQVLK